MIDKIMFIMNGDRDDEDDDDDGKYVMLLIIFYGCLSFSTLLLRSYCAY